MYAYAMCLIRAQGVETNLAEARKWLRHATFQNHTAAAIQLALMEQKGLGGPRDRAQGLEWYRWAAERGSAYGAYQVGCAYLYGDTVEIDQAEALRWFQQAAAGGHIEAKRMADSLQVPAEPAVTPL